jgi:hypothetical protein
MVFNSLNIIGKQQFHFSFSVEGQLREFVLLKLFNGDGDMIAKEYSIITKTLPAGLYQLHILSNEKFEQKLIRLDSNLHLTWQNKGSYSSIPADFLQSTRDYYQDAANEWSRKSTVNKLDISHNQASLFIFFRYPNESIKNNQENVAQSMGWRFSLLDNERKVIYRLYDEGNIKENTATGWLAFHVTLQPGIYFLVYKGNPKKREIPLYVFPGWQTQFFLTFKRTPIFSTTRIQLIRQGSHHELREEETLQLDALLKNLENGIYYVPQSLIESTAHSKWSNPILALAVCYAYLLSPEDTNDDLFRIMLRNIEQRILPLENASDLQALRLIAANHFEDSLPNIRLENPCMFNVGMKVFIDYSIKYPSRIKLSSICEEIISNLNSDTAWTSYKPIAKSFRKLTEDISEELSYLKEIDTKYLYSGNLLDLTEAYRIPANDWLSLSIKEQLMTKKETPITSKSLAIQFQVSQSMVENSIEKIKNEISDNEDPFLLQNINFEEQTLKDNIYKITNNNSNNIL